MSLAEIAVFFKRLRTRLAIIIAAAMLPAGVVAFHQALSVAERQEIQTDTLRESEAQERGAAERNLLVEVRESMNFALRRLKSDDFKDITCGEALKSEFQFRRWLTFAAFLDKDGNVICHFTGRPVPDDLVGWTSFSNRGVFTIGPLVTTGATPQLYAYYPDTGGRTAALAVGINVSVLQSYSQVGANEQPFALIDDDGEVITNSRADAKWLPDDLRSLPGYRRVIRSEGSDGKMRDYLVYQLMPGQIWSVSAYPARSTAAFILSSEFVAMLSPIVLWLIAVGVAYVAIDRLVARHVTRLKQTTLRIGQGQSSVRIGTWKSAPQEFQELGAAVDRMAASIEEREKALQDLLLHQKSLLMEVHHRKSEAKRS